jgi:hypothetical protein
MRESERRESERKVVRDTTLTGGQKESYFVYEFSQVVLQNVEVISSEFNTAVLMGITKRNVSLNSTFISLYLLQVLPHKTEAIDGKKDFVCRGLAMGQYPIQEVLSNVQ